MPNIAHVLVSDPKDLLPEGQIVVSPATVARAEAGGGVFLPVDEDIAPEKTLHPCDGFSIKSWGHGWLFNQNSAQRGCPHLIRVYPNRQCVHWVIRVVGERGLAPTGRFRLVADTSLAGLSGAGLQQVSSPEMLETMSPDFHGGYVLRGVARVALVSEALLALNVYGVARNARVVWSAVSLCSSEVGA